MWGIRRPVFSGAVNRDVQIRLDARSQSNWQFWADLDRQRVGELLVKPMDALTGWHPTWSGGRWIDWVHVDETHRYQGIAAARRIELPHVMECWSFRA